MTFKSLFFSLTLAAASLLTQAQVRRNKFTHIIPPFASSIEQGTVSILSFCEDHKGNVWIGTDGTGLARYNRLANTYQTFKHNDRDPRSLSADVVTYLYEDKLHNLWVGTRDGGLDRFDPMLKTFTHFKSNHGKTNTIQNGNITYVYEDWQSNLWIGTNSGIDLLDRTTLTFHHYNLPTLSLSSSSDMTNDRYGDLWIATCEGLIMLDKDTHHATSFTHHDNDTSSLGDNDVHTLFEDHAGRLWIGTSGGLSCFDRGTRQFKSYREKDGLPSDVIYGILEDNAGCLWISTCNGISTFDPFAKKFKNYNADDGLQGNEFNLNAFCKLKNGEMLFGGTNGYNIFRPSDIVDDTIARKTASRRSELKDKDNELLSARISDQRRSTWWFQAIVTTSLALVVYFVAIQTRRYIDKNPK